MGSKRHTKPGPSPLELTIYWDLDGQHQHHHHGHHSHHHYYNAATRQGAIQFIVLCCAVLFCSALCVVLRWVY
jgi:hypothetical protein